MTTSQEEVQGESEYKATSVDPEPSSEKLDEKTATIRKIEGLLGTKNDTTRLVGLALLKTVLDNTEDIRQDVSAINELWASVPSKFLDRMLRSSTRPEPKPEAAHMVDIAVAVVHTFAALVPDEARKQDKFVNRIPVLVAALLRSSPESTILILQTLVTLTASLEGSQSLVNAEDLSPLLEYAPAQTLVLDVLRLSLTIAASCTEDHARYEAILNRILQGLVISFKGTDAVTLLEFIDQSISSIPFELSQEVRPPWLADTITFVRKLAVNRPTAKGRNAYTNVVATLQKIFPAHTTPLLYASDSASERPFSYLLINLVSVDLRSSFPTLLERLNSPDYNVISQRLTSAFDIVSIFVIHLMSLIDEEGEDSPLLPLMSHPDLLLKLRKLLSETMSATIEYLRDRWDASVAGAMGLHDSLRDGQAHQAAGLPLELAWDSSTDKAAQDPLIMAAIICLAIWLRDDDTDGLREEATGLMDMLLDLYKGAAADQLDFRPHILVMLEGITATDQGREALLANEGWAILSKDLLSCLTLSTNVGETSIEGIDRGTDIANILRLCVESEDSGPQEQWMGVVTSLAALDVSTLAEPDATKSGATDEMLLGALQLAATLLSRAQPGMRKRYVHSTSAIKGIATQLQPRIGLDADLKPVLDQMRDMLDAI